MSSTTLITFLLYAPSSVRSVELLGSWDNFSRPYPMERDRRMGGGHWRGCHTFTDITRDGTSSSQSPGRTGALKMGGTYWYYYRLDGETEYYNEVEPITSLCPLLPGQPVNILNVPIVLPDTEHLHRRDNSTSSTKSEHRTMDPEDKYMNPRTPPKPKPGLTRLKTSPQFYQQTTPSSSLLSFSNSNDDRPAMSQPSTSNPSPLFRLAPKVMVARSVSPPRSRGIRAALLNIAGARSPAGDRSDDNGSNRPAMGIEQFDFFVQKVSNSNPSSNNSSKLTSPVSGPVELDGVEIGRLPFRHPQVDHEEIHGPPSIRVRRASKSSRDMTPVLELSLPSSSSSRETHKAEITGFARTGRLETLEEALSQQTTPMAVHPPGQISSVSDPATSVPPNLREKRLPTLPNSPSSVLDAELRAIDARYKPLDMEMLNSHFSDYTSIASDIYDVSQEKSRFSEWSTDTELVSPASMTSCSTFNADQLSNSSPLLGNYYDSTQSNENTGKECVLDAPTPSLAVSSPATPVLGSETELLLSPTEVASGHSALLISTTSASTAGQLSSNAVSDSFDFASLHIEDYDNTCSFHDSDPKRQGGILPLRVATPLSVGSSYGLTSPTRRNYDFRSSEDYSSQSAAMKELMDEIGYLGEMISSGL